jgi:hypothetical protein
MVGFDDDFEGWREDGDREEERKSAKGIKPVRGCQDQVQAETTPGVKGSATTNGNRQPMTEGKDCGQHPTAVKSIVVRCA